MDNETLNINKNQITLRLNRILHTADELEVETITITKGCYDGNAPGIGNVYSGTLSVTMKMTEQISKGTEILVGCRKSDSDAGTTIGVYYVDEEPAVTEDKMSITASDKLSESRNYIIPLPSTTLTISTLLEKTKEVIGSSIVFYNQENVAVSIQTMSDFLNREMYLPEDGKDEGPQEEGGGAEAGRYYEKLTLRDALAGVAILYGGNCYMDKGIVAIKPKTINKRVEIGEDYYFSGFQYSKNEYAIKSIALSFLPWQIKKITTEHENGSSFTREFIAYNSESGERVKNSLLESSSDLSGKIPYSLSVECDWLGATSDKRTGPPGNKVDACFIQGDLSFKTGSFSFCGYSEDVFIPGAILNITVEKKTIPLYCGEVEISWDGGFETRVSCNCNVEGGSVSSSTTSSSVSAANASAAKAGYYSSDAYFESISANEAFINNLTSQQAFIGSLTANEAFIKNLTSDMAFINELTSEQAFITNLTSSEAFIQDLTSERAFITELTASQAFVENLTANQAFIDDIQAKAITADAIEAATASVGYLKASEADARYIKAGFANIQEAEIDVANIAWLFSEVGLIDRATISEGHITGFLDSVQVNASNITAGTLDAGVIDVTNLKAANITVGQINGVQIAPGAVDMDNLADAVTGEISSASETSQKAFDEAVKAFNESQSASSTAQFAQNTADGKNTVFYQTSEPPGTHKKNDVWFETDNGNKMYYWNGSKWTEEKFGTNAIANASITNALIANLDAGKITTGTLSADRIGANTITANKMVLSNFTNYATVNENLPASNTLGNSYFAGTKIENGFIKAKSENGVIMLCEYGTNLFKNKDEIYYEMYIKGKAGESVVAAVWGASSKNGWPLLGYAGENITLTEEEKKVSGTIVLKEQTEEANWFFVGIDQATGKNVAIRKVIFYKKNGGELIVDGAITTDKIAAGAVETEKLAAGAVKAGNISAGAITTDALGADTVTAEKIHSRTITGDKIVIGAITATEIDVTDLFAQDITASGTIRGVTLAGTKGEIAGFTIGTNEFAMDNTGFTDFPHVSIGIQSPEWGSGLGLVVQSKNENDEKKGLTATYSELSWYTADKSTQFSVTDGEIWINSPKIIVKENITYNMYDGGYRQPLKVYAGNENGWGVSIGAGATTIVGSGESVREMEKIYPGTGESLVLSTDSTTIDFYTNCNKFANKRRIKMTNLGIFPGEKDSFSIGSEVERWQEGHFMNLFVAGKSLGGSYNKVVTEKKDFSQYGTGGWKDYTYTFSNTFSSIPLVSIMPTTQFASENIRLVDLTASYVKFQVYSPNTSARYAVVAMAVGVV